MTHPEITTQPTETCPTCKKLFVPRRRPSKTQKYCSRACGFVGMTSKASPPNPTGLCFCGCGQTTPIAKATQLLQQIVKGQHTRFVGGHHIIQPLDITPDNYVIDAETGCWNWSGGIDLHGYPKMRHPTKMESPTKTKYFAHRVSWEVHNGQIPEGMVIDHLCQNPACVNPDHLEMVTIQVNNQRGKNAKLTPDDVRRIRVNNERWTIMRWAEEYGVSKTTILHVRNRRRWKNVN